jgi:GNAT superfamily N-acetyltransferase
VRRVGPAEAARYRELRLRSLQDAPAAFGSTYAREVALPEAEWAARLARAATFVAEDDGGSWLGTAAGLPAGPDDPAVHLVGMWVAPDARGTGAGRLLVAAVLDWAATTGARAVRLTVVDDNAAARNLYARMGFRETGHRSVRERDGAVEVEMDLELAG